MKVITRMIHKIKIFSLLILFSTTLLIFQWPQHSYAKLNISKDDVQINVENGDFVIKFTNSEKELIEIKSKNDADPSKSPIEPKDLTFLGQLIPVGIVSTIISAAVALLLYYLNRKNAKAQIKFDLALKHLLPSVYIPILGELRNREMLNNEIDFNKIKKVIFENLVLLSFAPKKLTDLIDDIYKLCKDINSQPKYVEKEPELINLLRLLEKEINKRFGALKE